MGGKCVLTFQTYRVIRAAPLRTLKRKYWINAQKFKLNLTAGDIDICHRKGKPKADYNRRIIIKFTNYKARQMVYEARRNIGDGIFVQENLTRLRDQLAYEARKLVRSKSLLKTWVGGCKVYALMMINGKEVKIQIRAMEDIACIREGRAPSQFVP